MPELPEVETVRQILKKQIVGKTIKNVCVYYDNVLENTTKDMFEKSLINETINDILRYGKYLMFILNNYTIVSHLRMEGKYFIKPNTEALEKHEHVIFNFIDNVTLRYHDVRKFGKMVLLNTTSFEEIMKYPALKKLGIEANDPLLTGSMLYEKLKQKFIPIKTALLDQTIIAGLGNIYVDEVCFLSKLHPLTIASTLSLSDCELIVESSKKTLQKAINEGGTTIRSYTSSLGVTGRFQQHLFVHTKDVCLMCNSKINKIRVGGRGTYYCPNCQKQNKKIIGITGVIGSGKSTVSNYLIELGYEVIDSDLIVKELYTKETLKKLIENEFGSSFICGNEVDRASLANLIFSDETKRIKLNNLIHPLVKKEIEKRIKKSNNELIFIDVPLLFESNFDKLCDYTVVVYTNELNNIKRLMMRNNISLDEAKRKINSQMPMLKKCCLSDFIIDNSLDLCYTYERILELLEIFKK